MSELRQDPLSGDWVAIAPGRRGIGAARPAGLPSISGSSCPFCPGHEAETETTLLAFGDPWQVRVVANKYPLTPTHEVVIEAREHDSDLALYPCDHAASVFAAIRDRARALALVPGVAAISIFRNRGRRAGSSQPHPHTQIVGLPIVPPELARRAEIALRHPDVLARAVERERADATRVIEDRDGWITFCPYASRRAWETRIAPTFACTRLAELDDAHLAVLARRVVAALARLREVVGDPDYNVIVRDPPLGAAGSLTIDLLPRTGGDAGFEIQSGMGVCVVAPEEAARLLRG